MGTAEAHTPVLLQAGEAVLEHFDVSVDAEVLPRSDITVRATDNIDEVEAIWRSLTQCSIESPGQSFDFIKLWISHRAIPRRDQLYVVAEIDGRPIALLPLHRQRRLGFSVFTWFPSSQVGGYAPVADNARLAMLGAQGRTALWRAMATQMRGADAAYLRAIPTEVGVHAGLFDELGQSLAVDTLYRAQFSSWEEADLVQRSKSRRKHDRQQGDRLAALGDVSFELVTDPADGAAVIDTMFAQRSARFKAQGIRDTFVCDGLTDFYQRAMLPGSGIDVRLHVLRLNGDIVAVRYNIVHGDRMFCLISSMSDDCAIQVGSPGKQCLLRVMQTVFETGTTVFDMGIGFTDEKRHWCNVQLLLRQHYLGLTWRGQFAIELHRGLQQLRAWAKANPRIKAALRSVNQWRDGLKSKPALD